MDASNSTIDVLVKGSPKTISECQRVLENLYDSYNGYRACAEDCKDLELEILFQKVATNRFRFIEELSSVLRSDMGIEPVTSGSAMEAVHDSWINVKAWFNDGLDKAEIFPELHRGETHLIDHYITALSEPEHLTDKVWRVLQEQLKSIKEQDASLYAL
ncbi:hypothetical protein I4U23_011194 [Adineta vaga]|nr:hypothetical protein I4U23_011194 [Adineta vaga]